MIDQSNQSNEDNTGKQGFRRLYTSQIQQMPGQLSYQNIKLANFLQLELADLWDSLQQINFDNFKNQLKEGLSRSYNVFHEMKKLYNDLGMNFLYMQCKKLISSYGVIFVYLIDRLSQYERDQGSKSIVQSRVKQNVSSFDDEVRKNIQTIKLNKCAKQNKANKRNRGVHLFNESYARCVDYNVEAFRQLRQKIKQSQKSQEEKRLFKLEQEKKFKKEVVDQLNDFSYLKVDGQELYLFLNRHRKMDQVVSKISLEDELQKIAIFFKESQHQALQFLRKEKNLSSFHQLTQGFNLVVTDYQNNKTNQMHFMKDKLKQIFQLLKKKISIFEQIVKEKEKKIEELQHLLTNKQIPTEEKYTQTIFNYDEENKQLQRRVITTELINEELRMYITKINEQQRKDKSALIQQITIKDSNLKQIKETLQERLNYIVKIEKKYKMLAQNSKMKNIQDPFQFFNNMSEQMKKFFCEELLQQGYLKPSGKHEIKHSSFRRNTKHNQKKDIHLSHQEMQDKVINQQSTPQSHNTIQRKKSLAKKNGSNFSKESQNRNVDQQGKIQFLIPDQDLKSENQYSLNGGSRKNSFNEKETIYKSKKFITIRPLQTQSEDKVRVFDLHDKNGNSQKFMEFQSGKRLQQLRSEGSFYQNEKSVSNKSKIKKVRQKSSKTNKSEQRSQDQQSLNENQSNLKSQKSIKKSNSRVKKFNASKVSENSHEDSIEQQQQYQAQNKQQKNQRRPRLSKKKSNNQTSLKKKSSYVSKEVSQQQAEQKSSSKKPQSRIMRPSCQSSINTQLSPQITEKQIPLTSEQLKQKYFKHIKKCGIVNEFNLTIPNTPLLTPITSKSISMDQPINKSIFHDTLSQVQEKKQLLISQFKGGEQQRKGCEDDVKLYQEMKVTVRRITKKQISQNDQPYNRDSEISLGHRKTKTKNLKENRIKKESKTFIQSASSTFHKQFDKNKNKHQPRQSNDFTNNTQTVFKNSQKRQSKQKAGRSVQKTKSLIRVSQHSSNIAIKLIQEQFGQDDVVQASRKCNTIQQFKYQILNLHKSQCGQNCKHLERYINIFQKLKKQNYRTKRQFIKLHVENMNQKLGEEGAILNLLPSIGKK